MPVLHHINIIRYFPDHASFIAFCDEGLGCSRLHILYVISTNMGTIVLHVSYAYCNTTSRGLQSKTAENTIETILFVDKLPLSGKDLMIFSARRNQPSLLDSND